LETDNPSEEKDVKKQVKQKTRPLFFGAIGALIVGLVFNVTVESMTLAVLSYMVGFGLFITRSIIGNKYEKNIYKERQEEKKQGLINMLAKKGLKELSDEELKKIFKV